MIGRLLAAALLFPTAVLAQHEGHMGHDMSMPAVPLPTQRQRPALATPPSIPDDNAADALFDRGAMTQARAQIRHEHGGMTTSLIRFDLAEYRVVGGRDGYRWDAEGRFGGDVDRIVIKTEGAGMFGRRATDVEMQALWSHAIDPYFDLQAGLRHDILPDPPHTYVVAGVEGILPYWPELEATAFLSDKGDLTAEFTLSYDLRITQDLIVQPRLQATLAAQDVAAQAVGAGLSDVDVGLRLRYQLRPEIAPYIGIGWTRKIGDAADYARSLDDDPDESAIVIGLRTWF